MKFGSALIFLLMPSFYFGQGAYDKVFEAEYAQRIKKSRINETYIPRDFDDAFLELERLSSAGALSKFKNADEQTVARKLHFGLGKWMITNWYFYEGSRFSHFLKQKGLSYPDDMAQVTIRLFHRHLNGRVLDVESLIQEYVEARQKDIEKRNKQREVIDSFSRKRK